MKQEKASILVLTLWVLSFLSIFAIGLSRNVSSQLYFASHLQDRLRMYYLASAGIERAIVELQADEEAAYDSLNEKWASSEEFKEIPLAAGYISLYIKDEAGKININKAPLSILQNMLENAAGVKPDEAEDIANAIVDWRDIDIIVSPGGAEDDYYRHLEAPYPCKNGEFQIPEEVLLVKGMTPLIFSKIAGIITVYSEGEVNVNTAEADVLHALGLSSELAERVVKFRRGSDEIDGTEDDNIFKTPAEIRNIGPLFTKESEEMNQVISSKVLSVKSNVFRIFSSGIFKKGNRNLQNSIIYVVQRSTGEPPRMLYWHEGTVAKGNLPLVDS